MCSDCVHSRHGGKGDPITAADVTERRGRRREETMEKETQRGGEMKPEVQMGNTRWGVERAKQTDCGGKKEREFEASLLPTSNLTSLTPRVKASRLCLQPRGDIHPYSLTSGAVSRAQRLQTEETCQPFVHFFPSVSPRVAGVLGSFLSLQPLGVASSQTPASSSDPPLLHSPSPPEGLPSP